MKFFAPLIVLAAAVAAQDTSTTTSTLTTTVTSTCTVKYATVTSSSVAVPTGTAVSPVGGYVSTGTAPVGVYPTNVYNPSQVRGTAGPSGGSSNNATRPGPPIPTFTGAASSNGPQAIAAAVIGFAAIFAVC